MAVVELVDNVVSLGKLSLTYFFIILFKYDKNISKYIWLTNCNLIGILYI